MPTTTTTTTATEPSPVLTLRAGVDPAKLAERQHLKERLAGAYRIFGELGYDDGIAGHISVRDPINQGAFWVNPLAVPFEQITVDDLLLVDPNTGDVLDGSGKPGNGQLFNSAGFSIHSGIHKTRPDIHAVAHSHSHFGRTFSALGRNIDMISYDGAQYADTVRLYNNFGGVVLSDEESRNICAALGPQGKGVILQNHGILTAATTLEAAVAYFVRLERLCEAQLAADTAAGVTGVHNRVLADAEVDAVFRARGGEDEAFRQAVEELYPWIDAVTGEVYKKSEA